MNPLRHTALASILSLLAAAGCSAMRSGAPPATAYQGGAYAPARSPRRRW